MNRPPCGRQADAATWTSRGVWDFLAGVHVTSLCRQFCHVLYFVYLFCTRYILPTNCPSVLTVPLYVCEFLFCCISRA